MRKTILLLLLGSIVIQSQGQTKVVFEYKWQAEKRINWLKRLVFTDSVSGDTINVFDIAANNPYNKFNFKKAFPDQNENFQFAKYDLSGQNLDFVIPRQFQSNYLVNPIQEKKVWDSVVAFSNVYCQPIVFTDHWTAPKEEIIGENKFIEETNKVLFISIVYNFAVYTSCHDQSYLLGSFGSVIILDSNGNIYSKLDSIGFPVVSTSVTKDGRFALINCSAEDPHSKIGTKTIVSSLPKFNLLFELPFEIAYSSIENYFTCHFCSYANDTASYVIIDPVKKVKYQLLYPVKKACLASGRGVFDSNGISFSFENGVVERYTIHKDFSRKALTK